MTAKGLLAAQFEAVALKRLSAVEANPSSSNQHEFNGSRALKKVFGNDPARFPARFVWVSDEEDAVSEHGFLTWYDARERHPSRSEFRLYFPSTSVSERAQEGDALFIARRTDGSAFLVIARANSTIESQLLWLFGLPDEPEFDFEAQEIRADEHANLGFAVRYIFDELGIRIEEREAELLDRLVEPFGFVFPKMKEFSSFARSTLPDVSAHDDVDKALVVWMEREEQLFRRLERRVIHDRLQKGFVIQGVPDVEDFLQYSLSVQNRRKARAGAALENHLEYIFAERGIMYGRGCETEHKYKPDFLFPGCAQYRDANFPVERLTMLGAKSTLKDRWRQILPEADRIKQKHLLTLTPGLSRNQTDQMKAENVRLVVPVSLHATYESDQQLWLMTFGDFLRLVTLQQQTGA